jgi:DNA-binding transcriptional LysR family regulator
LRCASGRTSAWRSFEAPSYFRKRPEPKRPQDLIGHNCINLRLPTHGGLYAWEFEKGAREPKVRVEGQLVFNGTFQMLNAALSGFGLAYAPEDLAQPHLGKGGLKRVLEDWCPPYLGYHLYYPSRRQSSGEEKIPNLPTKAVIGQRRFISRTF